MKTYKQFNQELNERVNLKPIIKTVSKLVTKTKKPPRSIDPFFANKAVAVSYTHLTLPTTPYV